MSAPKPHRRLSLTQRMDSPEPESAPAAPHAADGPMLDSVSAILRDPVIRKQAFLVVPLQDEPARPSGWTEAKLLASGQNGSVVATAEHHALPTSAAPARSPSVPGWAYLAGGAAVMAAVALVAQMGRPHAPAPSTATASAAIPPVAATNVVLPSRGGVVTLTADAATVQGREIRKNPSNIGYWNLEEDTVSWNISPAPGKYAVDLIYACGPTGGGKFAVRLGGQELHGESAHTKDWNDYKALRVGEVNLNGPTPVVIQAVGTPGKGLMDLRSVKLYPLTGTHAPTERVAKR